MANLSKLAHSQRFYWRSAVVAIGLLLLFDLLTFGLAEGLWFNSVQYLSVYWLRLQTQVGLGAVAFLGSLAFAIANLSQAQRFSFDDYCVLPRAENLRQGLGLKGLLPLATGLALGMAILLLYHSQLALDRWHTRRTVASSLPPLPLWLNWQTGQQIVQQMLEQPWQLGFLVGVTLLLLIYPRAIATVGALAMSLSFGLVFSEQWSRLLPALNPTVFNQADPLFERDISFYIFRLPVLELVEFWLSGLLLFCLMAVTLLYLLAGNSLSQGRFIGFSSEQQRHLYGLAGGLLLATALSHWLTRYELLYSTQGVTYGAGYTDVAVDLPVNTGLSLISLGLAVAMLWRTTFWKSSIARWSYGSRPLIAAILLYLTFTAVGETVAPWLVQRLLVQPNELIRERPYIARSIAFTRDAFNLTDIQDEVFDPQGQLSFQDLRENELTIGNIRLWDTRPLLEANRQLQQIRLYYEFADADVDRYQLTREDGSTERRQVLISARELNYERVPDEAKTWVNQHLIYTHGYGFTMSPVNTAAPSGLPDYFIKDIGHIPSDPIIARSIPIGAPRLYFGELTNNYIMTSTKVQELDYPSGSDNVYTTYDGRGGINIGPFWRRLLYAKHLSDWQMLFTNDFTPATQLLFRRNIRDRITRIAPFLQFDRDPYLVIANTQPFPDEPYESGVGTPDQPSPNYLYWIIDAYTTSDRYPYADPGSNSFNYIRNSVKVVVDAYHGSVRFYIADPDDPIIQTWARLFPGMFQPLDQMPPALVRHIRYPQDYSLVQSNQLLTYHMTDPQVFYNREDQWRAPNEIYANEEQVVEPYYLIMRLP
ncbi:MAG: COG1615 family transporter, partial [Leptolyngbya sp. SIO4C1]|nr:COG1615 family transporter [Leptolyngbya sp. SIO4C1]